MFSPLSRRMLMTAALAALLLAGYRAQAGDCCNHRHCCPQCKTCVAIPEKVKEKKHCWNVECKDVCVPAIKWWWQPCCEPPRCGRVKTIKVLKKHEYECEHCGYKWEVRCCGSGCGDGSCGNGCCTNGAGEPAPAMDVPAPSPADVPMPPPAASAQLEFPRPAVYYPANK